MQTDRRPTAGFEQFLGVIVTLGMLFCGTADAQEGKIDPSDVWFSAFSLLQEGEAAEKKGNLLEAISKFNESKPLFDGLARQYPSFYPDIVRFRREQLVDVIANLRERMRNSAGSQLHAPSGNPVGGSPNPAPRPDPGIVSQGSLTPSSREFLPEGAQPFPNPNSAMSGGTPNTAPPVTSGGTALPEPWRPQQPVQNGGGSRMPDAVVRPPVDLTNTGNQDLGQIHQSRIQWMQGEIDRLNRRNVSLEGELEQRQQYLERIQADLAKAQRDATERNQQLQVAKADPNLKAQADELERLLNLALGELDKSNQQNQAVLAELEKTRSELVALRQEKDSIEKERDEWVAIVDGGENAATIQKLMNDNRRLSDRLAQAEAMAKQLGGETRDKDVEIALLKEQIQRIDSEREQLLADNRRYDSHISQLQNRLRELGQELSPEELDRMASVSPKLVEENELLRSVILKQLRRQNQIKQTKQILLEGLDKLGNEAADLYAMVEDMATGPAISVEERKMIREPSVDELVAASAVGQVEATVIVEGEEPDGSGAGILEVKKMAEELVQVQKAARLDYQEGRYEEAEENYLNFLRYRPRNVTCLCNLALVKITTKKYDEAEGLLEKAIALKDDNGIAYYLLGRTHFEQGRFDEALSRLNEGLRYDPQNAKAHNCVGVISSQKGFANIAEKSFTQAVTIDPKYGDAHFNLAVLFTSDANSDANRALDHYKKAISLGIPRNAAIEDILEASLLTAAATVSSN